MDVNQTANEIFQNPNDFLSKLYVLGKVINFVPLFYKSKRGRKDSRCNLYNFQENLLEDFDETVLSEKVSTTPSNGEKKEDGKFDLLLGKQLTSLKRDEVRLGM